MARKRKSFDDSFNILPVNPNVVQVSAQVKLPLEDKTLKVFQSNFKAKSPSCPMEIVLGIPTNFAACNVDNKNYNFKVDDARKTPIYEISKELRFFVKKLLPFRGCAIGVVPYSGNVSFPGDPTIYLHEKYVNSKRRYYYECVH